MDTRLIILGLAVEIKMLKFREIFSQKHSKVILNIKVKVSQVISSVF